MASADTRNPAWIAWLDYLPIIGTAKNTIETIIALINEDYEEAKAKGLQAAVGLASDVLTGGVFRASTTVIVRGTTRAATKTALRDLAKTTSKRMAATGIRMKDLSHKALSSNEEEEKSKAKRGEHVINNNVLKFFRNIIDEFISKELGNADKEIIIRPGTKVYEAYYHPLDPNDTLEISEKMVAQVRSVYGDANATIYGETTYILRTAIVNFMIVYYNELKKTEGTQMHYAGEMDQCINTIVQQIDDDDVFVDIVAKRKWLNSQRLIEPNRAARFKRVRQNVASMFHRLHNVSRDSGIVKMWVKEMRGGAISCGLLDY